MESFSDKIFYSRLETNPLSQPQLISSDPGNDAINVKIDDKRITEISLSFRNEPIQSRDGGLVVHIYNAETFEQDLNKEDYPGVDFFEFSKTELAAGKVKVKENTGSGHITTTVQLYPSNLTTDKEYYILIIWERFSTRILSLQAS